MRGAITSATVLKILSVLTLMVSLSSPVKAWHAGLPSGAVGPNLHEVRNILRAGQWKEAVARIDRLLPFLSGNEASVALFLAGKAKIAHSDPSGLDYLERIETKMPLVDNRRLYWLVKGYILRKDVTKAMEGFKRYRIHQQSNVEGVRLKLDLAELLVQAGNLQESLRLIEPLNLRRIGWAEQARVQRIKASSNPNADEQKELLRRLGISHPTIPLTTISLSRSERFRRADRLAQRWHYEEALAEYEVLLSEKYRRKACAWKIAVILQSKLRREPARVRELLAPITQSPNHKHHEEAVYRTIRAYIKEDLYQEAQKHIDAYDKNFPDGQYSEAIAYYRGWLPYDAGKCTKGLPALRSYVKRFTKRRRHVRGFIAWCHIRHSRWKSAIRGFAPLLREIDSMHRGKALYWQAYSYSKLGDELKAFELIETLGRDYPFSYYGFLGMQLKAGLQGHSTQASKMNWPTSKPTKSNSGKESWSLPKVHGALKRNFEKVRRLSELGELELARKAYLPIRDRLENAVPVDRKYAFMSFMAAAIEDFNRGYKATGIKRGSRRGMSPKTGDSRWHAAFPLAYRSLVENLAVVSSIHPLFIYSIMRAESAYMASAVSHAEAVGALQMIRPTAIKVASEIGLSYDPHTFLDPRVGFRYSVHYMRKHLDLWKGNFILAAASYNAGPEPVARWLKAHQEKALPFVVEEFVYNEARTYARRVAEFLLRYIALYPVPRTERIALLDALFPETFKFQVPDNVGY